MGIGNQFAPIPMQPGIYYVSVLPAPGLYIIGGRTYHWDGARWLTPGASGRPTSAPVKFILDPFLGVYKAANARPQLIWGNTYNAVSNGIVGSYLYGQRRFLTVAAFMERNSTLEIPLLDDEGIPFVGPEVPPLVTLMRNNGSSNQHEDYVGSIVDTDIRWESANMALRAMEEAPSQSMFSFTLRPEKEPTHHWVLLIHYSDNDSTSNLRTVLCHVIGQMSGVHTNQSIDAGSLGVEGHWEIVNRLTGADFNSLPSRTNANQLIAGTEQAYIAGGGTATIWLTDTGLSGGANLFSALIPPCVEVHGHLNLADNDGTTEANWRSSSWGMGYALNGTLADGVTSIRNPNVTDFDYYHTLDISSGKWRVIVSNTGTQNRQYHVFAEGVRA